MQHASDMPAVSLLENIIRRLAEQGKALRPGQMSCLDYVNKNPDIESVAFELVTGYGKSWVAVAVYGLIREQGRVNRLLMIVPTGAQRDQYAANFAADADLLGVNMSRVRVCGPSSSIRESALNTAEVFITTIQSIHADPGYYADLMEKGKWAICFDEFHRYRNGGEWGSAISNLPPYVARFGLSGTPTRTDKKDTFFGAPAVIVGLRDARKEGAIRGLSVHIEKYALDISMGGEHMHLTTKNIAEQLAEHGVSSLSEFEVKKEIKVHTKYVSSMITHGIDTMLKKQIEGLRHQTIIHAMSVMHAKGICDAVKKLYPDIKCDWVGSGPSGRTDKENKRVLNAFNADKRNYRHPDNDSHKWLDVLVQVSMAAEGFDSVYATTSIYLNLLNGKSVQADQSLGRGLRRHPGIDDKESDLADIFVSEDTYLADYYKTLEEEIGGGNESDDEMPGGGGDGDATGPLWLDVPEFFLLNIAHSGSELHYPIDHPPKGQEDIAKSVVADYFSEHPHTPELEALVTGLANKALHKAANPPLSDEEVIDVSRKRLEKSVNILAGNIVRRRFGDTFDRSAKADVIRSINSQLKKRVGRRDDLDADGLRRAYNVVRDECERIGMADDLPDWVSV